MCFGFSPLPSCFLSLGYFEFSHSILDKFKAFCLTLPWSKSQNRLHTNSISSLAVQRMKTTLPFWEFEKEVIGVCWVQGCRLGWVTWCLSNINPWIFLRGTPEVTKSNQIYFFISRCTSEILEIVRLFWLGSDQVLSFEEGPRTFLNVPRNETLPENPPGQRNKAVYALTLLDQYWAR